jgi:hypothetical protein
MWIRCVKYEVIETKTETETETETEAVLFMLCK